MMKALVLLAVLCLTGAYPNRYPRGPVIEFNPGSVYKYDYTFRIASGIPDMSDQHAIMELNTDLVLKVAAPDTVVMQIRDVQVGKLNEEVSPYDDDIPITYRRAPEYEKELIKPIKFLLQNGKVQSYTVESSDEDWSVNIKKAILDKLEVPLNEKQWTEFNSLRYSEDFPVIFKSKETSPFGLCGVIYHLYSSPESEFPENEVLNITKTFDYEDCEESANFEYHNMDVKGAPWVCKEKSASQGETETDYSAGCPFGFEQTESPMKPYSLTHYNLAVDKEGFVLEELYSETKISYTLYDRVIQILVHHNISLDEITEQRYEQMDVNFQSPVTKGHLQFLEKIPDNIPLGSFIPALGDIPVPPEALLWGVFEPVDVPEVKKSVEQLLEVIIEDIVNKDIESGRLAGQKTIQLMKAVALLPRPALREIFANLPSLSQLDGAPEKEQLKRKLFVDAASVCGGNEAALYLIDLIANHELTEIEAREVIEAIPDNLMYPNKEVVASFWRLIDSDVIERRSTVYTPAHVAFGKLLSAVVDNDDDDSLYHPTMERSTKEESKFHPEYRHMQYEEEYERTPYKKPYFSTMQHSSSKYEEDYERTTPHKKDYYPGQRPYSHKYEDVDYKMNPYAGSIRQEMSRHYPRYDGRTPNIGPFYPWTQHEKYGYENEYRRYSDVDRKYPWTQYEKHGYRTRYEHAPYGERYTTEGRHPQQKYERYESSKDTKGECRQVAPYIKELAKKLDEAERFRQKVTYIQTLAHTNCIEVIKYLRPYVRGEDDYCNDPSDRVSPSDCNLLRTVAIYSVYQLSFQWPDEVSSLVSNIYFNYDEDYEVRIAAFSVLINSQPSLPLLEKVVTELYQETNNQVVSFVYTALETLGNSSQPYLQATANRIQEVFAKIQSLEPDVATSALLNDDYYDDDRGYGLAQFQYWVESNVSEYNRVGYMGAIHNNGPFLSNFLLLGYQVKGLDKLVEKLCEETNGPMGDLFDFLCPETEPISREIRSRLEKLGIKTREHEKFKAFLHHKLFYSTGIQILDEEDVFRFAEQAQGYISQFLTSRRQGHYLKLIAPNSVHKIVVADYGIPAVLVKENPIIVSLKLKNVQLTYDKDVFGIVGDIHPQVYHTSHAAAYVVSPLDGYEIGTSVNKVYQMSLPVEVAVSVDTTDDKYTLSVKPEMPHQVFYHKTHARTFIQDTPTIVVSENDFLKDSEPIQVLPAPYEISKKYGHEIFGFGITFEVESDNVWADIPFWYKDIAYEEGILAGFLEEIYNPGWTYREVKTILDPDHRQSAKEYKIQLSYKYDLVKPEEGYIVDEEHMERPHIKKPIYHVPLERNIQGQEWQQLFPEYNRRQRPEEVFQDVMKMTPAYRKYPEYMEEARYRGGKPLGLRSYVHKYEEEEYAPYMSRRYPKEEEEFHYGRQYKNVLREMSNTPLDLHDWYLVVIPEQESVPTFHTRLTFRQTLDNKLNLLEIVKSDHDSRSKGTEEICLKAVLKFSEEPTEFYLTPESTSPAVVYATLGWNGKCSGDSQIQLKGLLKQDPTVLKKILRVRDTIPSYYTSCLEDQKEGKSQSEDCEQAISEDNLLNKMIFNISYTDVHPWLYQLASQVEQSARAYYYPNVQFDVLTRNEPDTVSLEVEYVTRLPQAPMTNVYVYKPEETVAFEKLYTPDFTPLSSVENFWDNYDEDYQEPNICNIMENYIRTFDDVTYELPEDSCEYLVAKDCSEHETFAVIMKQLDPRSNKKVVEVYIAGDKIYLEPFSPQQGDIYVTVNDRQYKIVSEQVVILNMSTPLYITVNHPQEQRLPPVVTVYADDYDIEIKYDGLNAKIDIPERYRGKTCGLCGDNNDEEDEEFTGPGLCLYTDSTDFAHSYLLNSEQCQASPRPENPFYCPEGVPRGVYRRDYPIHRDDIHREYKTRQWETVRPGNPKYWKDTIGSYEGHETAEERYVEHHTKVIKRGEELCFSLRPVKKCVYEAKPVKVEEKNVPFHCIQDTPYTRELANQAEVRVIKEVVDKKPDFYETIRVPVYCEYRRI